VTNHFKLNATQAPDKIYIWNVNAREANNRNATDKTSSHVNRRALELLLQRPEFGTVYSDYSTTLVSWRPLTDSPSSSATFDVDYYEPEEGSPRTGPHRLVYTVIITPAVAPLPTQPLKDLLQNPRGLLPRADEYEHALNIMLLRFAGQHSELTTAARGTKVFSLRDDNKRQSLGRGLSMYRGYVRRIRILQGGLYLCLNTTAGVMYDETWTDLLIEAWQPSQHPRNPTDYVRQLEQFLRGVRVKGMFGEVHRVKPIFGVAHTSEGKLQTASEITFQCDRHPRTQEPMNKKLSVQDYFKMAYPDHKFRGQPLIVLNVGTSRRAVWWPATSCVVLPGQPYRRPLPFSEQSRQMIRSACRGPSGNIELVEGEGLAMLGISRRNAQASAGDVTATPLQAWMTMDRAPARRLQPPVVHFLNGTMSVADAAKGQWNLSNKKFNKAGEICKYTVLVMKKQNERPVTNLNEFISRLGSEIAKYMNLPHSQASPTRLTSISQEHLYPSRDQGSWLKALFRKGLGQGIRYCIIIPSDTKWYGDIKAAADSIGMQTTITLRKRGDLVKSSMGEIANLLLKFNLKLGGTNWALQMSDFSILAGRPTMFVGIDVIHAPPGAMKDAPSVAAVVASINPIPAQFPGIVDLQHHSDPKKKSIEMIPNLGRMFESRLELWAKKNNGDLPKLLFVYRDGVSDSQLVQVLDIEVPLMEEACKTVYGRYQKPFPQMYVQSTQKRHIVRFYAPPEDRSDAFDNRGNPLPGLVVDRQVVSKDLDDWYGVSHKCLQGTSRPAHHYRVYDEVKGSPDELQYLTNSLAYIFGRSVTSISIPAPARLADRLCERAKYHLFSVFFPSQPDQVYRLENHFKGQCDIHPDIRDTMYYI
jgi:Piwi domain/N-terminal domain of argonaute/Argonaute linker 1 domain